MAKGRILSDSFEALVEQGQKTGKTVVKSVTGIVSPTKIIENVTGTKYDSMTKAQIEQLKSKQKNHTPLNFENLGKNYQEQEKQKINELSQRLFQYVKRGEEKAIAEIKQEDMDKKRKEEYDKEEKKQKQLQKQRMESQDVIPHGKERKSIFSPKKVAKREQAEFKPSSGKQ